MEPSAPRISNTMLSQTVSYPPAPVPPAHLTPRSLAASTSIHPTMLLHSARPEHETDASTFSSASCSGSSKTTVVESEITHLPNGFLVGSMSDEAFCHWVLSNSAFIRDTIVEDVTWWSANQSPLHHQFVVLSINYTRSNTAPSMYNIVLERVGKRPGLLREAQHRVTIHHAQSVGGFCSKNRLMLGLFNASVEERDRNPARWRWIADLEKLRFWHTLEMPGFATQLDETWRGPPATLAHVARIMQHIVALAPQYSLAGTNCYYFSRLLVHAIALRHYSFSSVVRRMNPSASHANPQEMDQSTTPIIFSFFEDQENFDGTLSLFTIEVAYGILALGVPWIATIIQVNTSKGFPQHPARVIIGLGPIGLGCLAYLVLYGSITPLFIRFLIRVIIIGVFTLMSMTVALYTSRKLGIFVVFCAVGLLILSFLWQCLPIRNQWPLPLQTRSLIRNMDDDVTMTHPRGKRGWYDPQQEIEFQTRMRDEGLAPWPNPEQRFENLPRFYTGQPVELPPPV